MLVRPQEHEGNASRLSIRSANHLQRDVVRTEAGKPPEGGRSVPPVITLEGSIVEDGVTAPQNAAFREAWDHHIEELHLNTEEMEKVKNKETSELRSYYTELLGDLHDVGGNKMGSAKFQKWLKSIIPHLKSAASVMDLVQAVAQADPILKLVFGLVKGVLDVRNPPSGLRFEVMTIHFAIRLGDIFDDVTREISHLLELWPSLDECGKQDENEPHIHNALVAVYKDLLSFYREAQSKLSKRFLGEADRATMRHIVDGFQTHIKDLHMALQIETYLIVKNLKALAYSKDEQKCLEELYERGMDSRSDLRAPAEGTCTWVFAEAESIPCQWRDGRRLNILVMVGDVGCGKTTLAESIRHSLEVHVKTRLVSEPATLCVFFCKDDGESGTEIAILRGLLHQMASNDRDLLKHLARRSTGKPIGLCSVDDLEHVVSSYIRSVERKFILVIDGVDECKESSRTRFLKFLRAEIHEIDPGRLKVMLLTRPYRSIMHILPDTEYCKQFQLLEIQRQDMEKIIDYHVAEFMNKGPYEKEVRELLTKELLSRAEGSPQWVKLVLDFLYETGATKAINLGKFLRQVRSADLESVYSRLFEQIPLPSRKYAEQVLCIIAGACRPLSLDELSYATTLDLEDQSEMTLGGLKKRCDPAWILNSLGPLIRTHDLKAESKVYLVHQSLKDLIMRGPPTSWSSLNNLGSTTDTSLTQFDSINNLLASLCIFYLRLSVFEDASLFLQEDLDAILPYYPESETEEEEVTGPPPFFEYASVHWSVHFKASSKLLSTELIQHSMSLSRPNTHRLFNWSEQYRQHMIQTVGWDPLPPLKAIDPLVTAAFFGHHNVVSTILDDISCNLNPDHSGHNACIWASRNGHSGILKTILSHKAYVSLGRAVLNECLYSATEGDHEQTAKTILNLMDLEPDEQITFLRGDGSSPLLVAVKYGFFDIAQLLLAKSDISHGGMELLDSAIPTVRHDESPKMKLSRVKILEMLVRDVRVDIAARNKRGVTILSRAAQVGCSSAIEILLQSGRQDDILSLLDDSGDEEGRSPLWHAAHWNKTEVVRLLCDQDGIENQLRCIDRVNGENVIAAAARYSNRAIVQMLLDKYPNGVKSLDDPSSFLPWIESRDHAGRTPLSTTALNQEDGADIAQILLETGRVDVESRSAGPSGYSALDYAVLENAPLAKNIDLCRVLIVEGGADWRSVVSFSEGGEPTLLKVPIFPGFDNDELLRGLCQIIDEVRTDS